MRYVVFYGILGMVGVMIIIPAILTVFMGISGRASDNPQNISAQNRHSGEDMVINVYLADIGQTVTLNLEEYVKRVVAAEMPAEFEIEALKAQAVAVRTYAAKHMKAFGGKGNPEYNGAEVTSNYQKAGGQAFANEDDLRAKWGGNYEKYWNKISLAVDSTKGIVLTYNGEIINAVFHSTSGERTASAQEVWGAGYDYLKSVPCSWDKLSPKYTQTIEISLSQMQTKLGTEISVPAAAQNSASGILDGAVNVLERTESGRVEKIKIGSKIMSGQEAREKLELRSTNFYIESVGDKFTIKTIGYGHGVGLCQYGANGQAKEGKTFRQILTHYYSGVDMINLFGS